MSEQAEVVGAMLGRVRAIMDQKKISQQELGRRLGTSQATVNAWLRGATAPSGELLLRLPAALDVDPMWLFYGEELGSRLSVDFAISQMEELLAGMRAARDFERTLADSHETGAAPGASRKVRGGRSPFGKEIADAWDEPTKFVFPHRGSIVMVRLEEDGTWHVQVDDKIRRGLIRSEEADLAGSRRIREAARRWVEENFGDAKGTGAQEEVVGSKRSRDAAARRQDDYWRSMPRPSLENIARAWGAPLRIVFSHRGHTLEVDARDDMMWWLSIDGRPPSRLRGLSPLDLEGRTAIREYAAEWAEKHHWRPEAWYHRVFTYHGHTIDLDGRDLKAWRITMDGERSAILREVRPEDAQDMANFVDDAIAWLRANIDVEEGR